MPAAMGGGEGGTQPLGAPPTAAEAPGGVMVPRPTGRRGPVRRFLHRQRDDLIRDTLLGLILAGCAFGLAALWDGRMADRQEKLEQARMAQQEVLENTRFVREVSLNGGEKIKPFQGLQLSGAHLSSLELQESDFTGANLSGADLVSADLTNALLYDANLADADLTGALLSGAMLPGADLTNVNLTGAGLDDAYLARANLTGADLTGADLTGADLSGADLTGADLTAAHDTNPLTDDQLEEPTLVDVCYEETTIWPDGFEPPRKSSCSLEELQEP